MEALTKRQREVLSYIKASTLAVDYADAVPILRDQMPPAPEPPGWMLAKGTGPWQRKARQMAVGDSLRLPYRQADNFRRSCTAMGIRTRQQRQGELLQVWIVSKPEPTKDQP